MLYSEARKLIKTGDILTFAGTWWMSRLIRLVTRQTVSHIGVAVWLNFNGESSKRLCMFEAMEGRDVRIVPLDRTLQEDYWSKGGRVYWQTYKSICDESNNNCTKQVQGTKVMDYCLQHWGDGYANPWQFVVILTPHIRMLRKWLTGSLDTSKSKEHCSELVSNGIKNAGYTGNTKESCITTPGDVSAFSCLTPSVELFSDYPCHLKRGENACDRKICDKEFGFV